MKMNRKTPDVTKNGGKTEKVKYPFEWLYLAEKELTIRDIVNVFGEDEVELWEEAGVAEVFIKGGRSVDFEEVDMGRADEATRAFLEENGTKKVFLVTIVPEDYKEAEEVMKHIINRLGGFFCGDTPDFTPVVKA